MAAVRLTWNPVIAVRVSVLTEAISAGKSSSVVRQLPVPGPIGTVVTLPARVAGAAGKLVTWTPVMNRSPWSR